MSRHFLLAGIVASLGLADATVGLAQEKNLVQRLVSDKPERFAIPRTVAENGVKGEVFYPAQRPGNAASVEDGVGLAILKHCLLISLRLDGTEDQFEELLEKYKFDLDDEIAPIPDANIVAVRIRPGETPGMSKEPSTRKQYFEELFKLTAAVEQEKKVVRAAAPNSTIGRAGHVPSYDEQSVYREQQIPRSVWSFRHAARAIKTPMDGTYGLSVARFPAAWNFNQFIDGRNLRSGFRPALVPVWVADVGYAVHSDLEFSVVPGFEALVDEYAAKFNFHGIHVAGIIGAKHGNKQGIDGACRYCDLRVASVSVRSTGDKTQSNHVYVDRLLRLLTLAANADHPPRVINASLGYNWSEENWHGGRQEPTDIDQQTIRKGAKLIEGVLGDLADKGVIVVSAAGNDSARKRNPARTVSCRWGNIINYAATHSDRNLENVIIVEAIDRLRKPCVFSNGDGMVSAAGDEIHSLCHYDTALGANTTAVQTANGTSQAAPFVTGLIAQLYAYNPDLTMPEVVRIVKRSCLTLPDGSHLIDAFTAMLRAHPDSLTHLADLNGDGVVNQQDARLMRQALAKLAANQFPDNHWPRFDLNGDGELHPTKKRKVWVPALEAYLELTDFEVLDRALGVQPQRNAVPPPRRVPVNGPIP